MHSIVLSSKKIMLAVRVKVHCIAFHSIAFYTYQYKMAGDKRSTNKHTQQNPNIFLLFCFFLFLQSVSLVNYLYKIYKLGGGADGRIINVQGAGGCFLLLLLDRNVDDVLCVLYRMEGFGGGGGQ